MFWQAHTTAESLRAGKGGSPNDDIAGIGCIWRRRHRRTAGMFSPPGRTEQRQGVKESIPEAKCWFQAGLKRQHQR